MDDFDDEFEDSELKNLAMAGFHNDNTPEVQRLRALRAQGNTTTTHNTAQRAHSLPTPPAAPPSAYQLSMRPVVPIYHHDWTQAEEEKFLKIPINKMRWERIPPIIHNQVRTSYRKPIQRQLVGDEASHQHFGAHFKRWCEFVQ